MMAYGNMLQRKDSIPFVIANGGDGTNDRMVRLTVMDIWDSKMYPGRRWFELWTSGEDVIPYPVAVVLIGDWDIYADVIPSPMRGRAGSALYN